MKINLNKERQEIVDIYKAKGFQGDELQKIVDKITSNKDVWLKTMLTEELGINLEILGSPFRGALVMFGAFLLGGILPILPYFAVKAGLISSGVSIAIAIGVSVVSSFIVGAIKGRMAKKNWFKGGIENGRVRNWRSACWLRYRSRTCQDWPNSRGRRLTGDSIILMALEWSYFEPAIFR